MEAEYRFFMLDRRTPSGLNAYRTGLCRSRLLADEGWLSERVGHPVEGDDEARITRARELFSIAESGWDFNYRFRTDRSPFDAMSFSHVDLCSLLFDVELKLAELLVVLGEDGRARGYADAARERRRLMDTYMRTADGLYMDYNEQDGTHGTVLSAASLYPFAVGVSDDREALLRTLSALELPEGISAGAYRGEGERYLQWDYPSMWPPVVYFAYVALRRLGLDADARRIGGKYMRAVENTFAACGDLYEKYDARDGSVSVTSEYETPAMLGWTAGVYTVLAEDGL
jgi:alpha,alpha-trehalase